MIHSSRHYEYKMVYRYSIAWWVLVGIRLGEQMYILF